MKLSAAEMHNIILKNLYYNRLNNQFTCLSTLLSGWKLYSGLEQRMLVKLYLEQSFTNETETSISGYDVFYDINKNNILMAPWFIIIFLNTFSQSTYMKRYQLKEPDQNISKTI